MYSDLCLFVCLLLVTAVRLEKQEESSQDGEEEQSSAAGEQVALQVRFQVTLVCQRRPEAHDGVLAQTAETGGEDRLTPRVSQDEHILLNGFMTCVFIL